MFAIHIHTLLDSEYKSERAQCVLGCRSGKSKSGKVLCVMNDPVISWSSGAKNTRKHQTNGTVKCLKLDLALFEVGLCEWGKQHIIRHHSVLFHVAGWKGCYWVLEGRPLICEMLDALWKDQAYDLSQYVCVSALMLVSARPQCFVRNAWYCRLRGSAVMDRSHDSPQPE